MPSSSFFSGLDQVAEHPRKDHRNYHGYPSSLKESPYLSSPIRPIPSFSRHRSCNLSVSSKRSRRTIDSATNSQDQSTVGSLRLTSPYSESIFSLHSLCTTSSKPRKESEGQSLSRSVLLPHEIDVMIKQMKVDQKDINPNCNDADIEKAGEDEQYDLSDFDDDSTIASDTVKSICDDDVYNLMQKDGGDEFPFQKRFFITTKDNDVTTSKGNSMDTKNEQSEGNDEASIRLPSVHVEPAKDLEIPEKKVKMNPTDKYSELSLKRSPYAVNQSSKTKRSTGRKKKKTQDKNIYV